MFEIVAPIDGQILLCKVYQIGHFHTLIRDMSNGVGLSSTSQIEHESMFILIRIHDNCIYPNIS